MKTDKNLSLENEKRQTNAATQSPLVKGADLLICSLEKEGIDTVFAYPGGTSLEIHQAMTRHPSLRVVLPRHEQGGVFAASGYARATGRVGVCIATSGPGATNLVTGIADAYMDSIPLVVITGQVSQQSIGRNAFQETDFFGITLSISKYSYLVTNVNDIPRIIKEAFYLASTGRPGPVVIDIPKNIQQQQTVIPDSWPTSINLRGYTPDRKTSQEDLLEVVKMIEASKSPLICAGGGIISANASEALRQFVKLTQIPIATTLMGIGSFPEDDPLSLQLLGMHGTAYANWASKEADLFLAFGCRFDDRVTGNPHHFVSRAKIIHIDIDPSEINKNKHVNFSIEGDIGDVLERMNSILRQKPLRTNYSEWHKKIDTWKKKAPLSWRFSTKVPEPTHIEKLHKDGFEEVIMPQQVIEMLTQMTKQSDIIVTGVGQHQMWTAQFYQFKEPRTLLTSGGLGSMGYGYPAALGAKVGCPNKQVIDIDGDGSFQMNIQELATAHVEKIAVKTIILNNQWLGMVKQWEDAFYHQVHANTFIGDPSGEKVIYPDFVKIAEGYSVKAERVIYKRDLKAALQRMLEADEPYILDIITPCNAKVLPFIKSAGTVEDMVYE